MNRLLSIISVTACGCFALGFSSAYYLVSPGGAPAIQNEPQPRKLRPLTYVDSIIEPTGSSATEIEVLESGIVEKVMADRPSRPVVPEQLVERLLSNRTTEDILPQNTVSDELADCLGMTLQERTTVDEALKTALTTLKEEQRKRAKITQTDDDSTTFIIDRFDVPGRAIKEVMRDKVNESLGLDRSLLFMSLAKNAIHDSFLDFGKTDVKIEMHGLTKGTDYEIIVQSGAAWRRFETSSVPDLLQGLIEMTPMTTANSTNAP